MTGLQGVRTGVRRVIAALAGLVVALGAVLVQAAVGGVRAADADACGVQQQVGTSHDQPTGIALDPNGNLWVAESNGNRVGKYDPDRVGIASTSTPFPRAVAADAASGYFASLTTGAIYRWTVPQAVITVATGFSGAYGMAATPAGDLYIADTSRNRIVKLTPAGVQTELPFTGLNQPMGVAVDGAGNVFVADRQNHRVVVLSPAGVQSTVGFTGLNLPSSVAVGPDGTVYVVSFSNGQMQKLSP